MCRQAESKESRLITRHGDPLSNREVGDSWWYGNSSLRPSPSDRTKSARPMFFASKCGVTERKRAYASRRQCRLTLSAGTITMHSCGDPQSAIESLGHRSILTLTMPA